MFKNSLLLKGMLAMLLRTQGHINIAQRSWEFHDGVVITGYFNNGNMIGLCY